MGLKTSNDQHFGNLYLAEENLSRLNQLEIELLTQVKRDIFAQTNVFGVYLV